MGCGESSRVPANNIPPTVSTGLASSTPTVTLVTYGRPPVAGVPVTNFALRHSSHVGAVQPRFSAGRLRWPSRQDSAQKSVSFGHVFIVVEENHNYSDVVANPVMPYLNGLANQYGLAANY